jgi:hypothetical protein
VHQSRPSKQVQVALMVAAVLRCAQVDAVPAVEQPAAQEVCSS